MTFDPFAQNTPAEPAPVEAPQAAAPAAAPVHVGNPDADKITVTLKGGAGFEAPWIVIHANSIEEANAFLGADMTGLMERTQRAAAYFQGQKPVNAAPAVNTAAPAGAAQAPAGSGECPPGWTFKAGVGKNGKPWSAYMPPRGSSESPIWL